MTILIYHLETVNGDLKMVEYGRFNNGKITGKIEENNMTQEQVIKEFNSGYWRTSEV